MGQTRKQIASVIVLALLTAVLIHFQDPQMNVYMIDVPGSEVLTDSPMLIQNIGNGLLLLNGCTLPPNATWIEPKKCMVLFAVGQRCFVLPSPVITPPLRGWFETGVRISLDGKNWARVK